MKFSYLVDLCEMPLPILDIKREPLTKLPDGTYTGIGRFNCRVFALDADETKYHRVDGPAVDCSSGRSIFEEWWLNGQRHRVGGPAVIRTEHEEWYVNGQRHRVDGPAVIVPGYEEWYINGQRHRIGGPALVTPTVARWYIEGVRLTEEDYNNLMEKLSTITDDSDKATMIAAATMFD